MKFHTKSVDIESSVRNLFTPLCKSTCHRIDFHETHAFSRNFRNFSIELRENPTNG
jgi:hypothetical protein